MGREYFGGSGGLSKAWRNIGVPIETPMEGFPDGEPYRADHDLCRKSVASESVQQESPDRSGLRILPLPAAPWVLRGVSLARATLELCCVLLVTVCVLVRDGKTCWRNTLA